MGRQPIMAQLVNAYLLYMRNEEVDKLTPGPGRKPTDPVLGCV